MNSFKAYFNKEVLEAKRQHKYLIVAAAIIFFAVFDPILLKLLPRILESQIPGGLTSLFKVTREAAALNYFKDLFQIGNMVIVFVIASTICEEIKSKRIIIPLSKGAELKGIVIAKYMHFVFFVIIAVFAGFLVNYYYINILYSEGNLRLTNMIHSFYYHSLYYCFIIALTMFFSSMVSKSFAAGIMTLAVTYILSAVDSINKIAAYFPHHLLSSANELKNFQFTWLVPLVLIYCMALIYLTIKIFDIRKSKFN
ncbi:hypothetical protein [Clostridium polynesiense]|uniref:hypothetical protein n=1 Tax=Clostridium polynesiense TaxID=1325933 RepID=UPI0005912C29|nr:hypothetical protein [Clostridium polynesiense]